MATPSSLSGHMISFPQSLDCVTSIFPRSDMDEVIRVQFIGGKASWERMMPMLGADSGPLQIRPLVVFSWLRRLKETHPLYARIIIDDGEQSVARMEAAIERILSGAIVTDDAASANIERAARSDVAAACDPVGFGELVLENQDAIVTLEARVEQFKRYLNISATVVPLNEFENNELVISGAFPWIFMFGRVGVEINALMRRTIVLQHSARISKEAMLIFFLFNQLQRHRVTHNVAKASEEQLEVNCLARRHDFSDMDACLTRDASAGFQMSF